MKYNTLLQYDIYNNKNKSKILYTKQFKNKNINLDNILKNQYIKLLIKSNKFIQLQYNDEYNEVFIVNIKIT